MSKFIIVFVLLGNFACGSEEDFQFSSQLTEVVALDGAKLYTATCARCHGALPVSKKRGKTANQITKALATIKKMQTIKMTAPEVNAIAAALNF